MNATYSPDDNKLRLYSEERLSPEIYAKVRDAGFRWAPQQKLFVAPAWSPEREDLLLELCGEIEDDDTSLVDRAAERAERFEEYSDKRKEDAQRAHEAVSSIADNIPLGQPILVGHHSEARARRDAKKIQRGMEKAVRMWDTSKYWASRAKGALASAKYKELPGVRHRRIEGLEADVRRCKAAYTPKEPVQRIMQGDPREPHVWCSNGGRSGSWVKEADLPALEKHYSRWITHYEHRIEYEKAMLQEQGGLAADKFNIIVGGKVLYADRWLTVLKVNRSGGKIKSLTTNNTSYPRVVPIEFVKDYEEPTASTAAVVKANSKIPPLCNYPGWDGKLMMQVPYGNDKEPREVNVVGITQQQWDRVYKDSKCTVVIPATEKHVAHRVRYGMFGAADPAKPYSNRYVAVYLTDKKITEPAKVTADDIVPPPLPGVEIDDIAMQNRLDRREAIEERQAAQAIEAAPFEALREAARTGVQTVAVDQLFATPLELAERLVKLADIKEGFRVLEPSAGTGALLEPMYNVPGAEEGTAWILGDSGECVAVEINDKLAHRLESTYVNCKVVNADFLTQTPEQLGYFDRVIMNPPFKMGADVEHIKHAMKFLKPGGMIVALCANGPKQREKLSGLTDTWEDLPGGSFAVQGTNVNVALVTIKNGSSA